MALRSRGSAQRERERERLCFTDYFYSVLKSGKYAGTLRGFPLCIKPWCKKLKLDKVNIRGAILSYAQERKERRTHDGLPDVGSPGMQCGIEAGGDREFYRKPDGDGRRTNIVSYVGIAADEPLRIKKHIDKPDKVLPLVQIGWDEALCGLEAQYMNMLAPTYETGERDGCWFCHNQGVAQLRRLRRNYPDLWALLLKWDSDSPTTFKPDGHTVHDFDRRFEAEDAGLIDTKAPFRWAMLDDDLNYNLFAEM